jgi:carboxyl-terminal processing protease
MKKLKTFTFIAAASFVGFFSALSFSQIKIKPLEFDGQKITASQSGFIDDVIGRVKRGYVDEKTDRELEEAAASGILSSLDPHSSYMNEEDLKEVHVQTKGEFGGLGIEITMEMMVVKIVSPIEGTPAFRAGIKSGDYIIKINGETVVGLSITDVVKKLRGKPQTSVKVTILRKGTKEPFEVKITREIIKVKAVRSAKFNDVAYVKINTFSRQAYKGLEKELKKLKSEIGEKNLKGLVLDLRNNPGGLLDQAIKVSDAFLDKGKNIVSIKGRSSETKNYDDEADESLVAKLPIVVLINEGSASASEIVAGALQDHNRAIIMGVKSFGKGSVQTIIPLEEGQGALRLTTSLYYTPSGKSIQAHGIEPDIEVTSAKIEKDKPLDRSSESDLKGHIEVRLQQVVTDSKVEKLTDENLALYDEDYQLARALDLVRGISLYQTKHKKISITSSND